MSNVLLIDNSTEPEVILVPVSTVQPDLVTQTDVVVYVPLASKIAPGIVRIGEGLTIDHTGLLNFDRSEVTIKAIAKNGVDLEIDENKRVNIVLNKADVGLNYVDNTSDKDKPVSDATKAAISQVDNKLNAHIIDYNNPHRVTKTQVGLSNVDNTSDLNKPISKAVQKEFDRVAGLIKGVESTITYDSYKTLIDDVKNLSKTAYKIGQSVYILTLNVPDLWIYDVVDEFQEFEYTDDATIESLLVDGTLNVGYYKFAALETLKVNLEDYVTLSSRQTITGDKNFTGDLRLNGMDVATIDDVNSVTLDTLHFQPTDGSIIYANDKVYYQGEFSYTTINNDDPVTVDGTIVLPIKGDGVTLSSDGSNLIIKAVIPEIDTSNLVNLDGIQTITGVKTFTEQIGILNGGDGDINYIKHLNNNFLVSSSDGENIINIDEQLKTFNFYNKPLALEEYVDDNFVSYTTPQTLTEEQKAIVRDNIGAGEAGHDIGTIVSVNGVTQTTWDADTKLDKRTHATTYDEVYYKAKDGKQGAYILSDTPLDERHIVQSDHWGYVSVKDPIGDNNPATRLYVDKAFDNVKDINVNEFEKEFTDGYSDTELSDVATWTKVTSPSGFTARQRSCCYGNGYYVIAGTSGQIAYSKDAINWVNGTSFTSAVVTGLAYGNGWFLAVDSNGYIYRTDDPSKIWSPVYQNPIIIESIRYVNNKYYAVGQQGFIGYSFDGYKWTQATVDTTNTFIDIGYGNGKYVAVGHAGTVFTSVNGITWYDKSIEGYTTDIRAVYYANGNFVIGTSGGRIDYSEDGETWTQANNPSSLSVNWIRNFTYHNNRLYTVMYVSTGQGEIWVSKDKGKTWSVEFTPTGTSRLWCVCSGNDKFITSGDNGNIFVLDMDLNWQDKPTDGTHQWYRFKVSQNDGSLVYSDAYYNSAGNIDLSGYYTKNETDSFLEDKANKDEYLSLNGGTMTGTLLFNNTDTQIKTAKELIIQTGGGQQYVLTNTEFRPTSSYVDTLNIGKSDRRFKDGYFSGTVTATTMSAGTVNADKVNVDTEFIIQAAGDQQYVFTDTEFRPTSKSINTLNIGRNDRPFHDAFFEGTIYQGGKQVANKEDLPSIDGLATEQYVDEKVAGIGNVFELKGTKYGVPDLPTEGNSIGDVWYVKSEQVGYIWINDSGTERWEQLGPSVDLSNYVEQSSFNSLEQRVLTLNDTLQYKANRTELDNYALINNVYEKESVNNLISPKADTTYVDNQISMVRGLIPDVSNYVTKSAGVNQTLTGPLYITPSGSLSWGRTKGIILGSDDTSASTIDSGSGFLKLNGQSGLAIGVNNSTKLYARSSAIEPATDNSYQLGTSSNNFSSVYAYKFYAGGREVATKNDIPDVNGLATKTELSAVEDKIPDISNLATKAEIPTDYVDLSTVQNISGLKNFTTMLTYKGTEVALKDLSNVSILATVATSGSYNDLSNKPTIPSILNAYPVGAVYISVNATSPASLFGGTWAQIGAGYALWTATSGAGGTIGAGLPNVTGQITAAAYGTGSASGAFTGAASGGAYTSTSNLSDANRRLVNFNFNATRSNGIYGASTTVQPPAYKVYAWQRTA